MSDPTTRVDDRPTGGMIRWWFWAPLWALPVATATTAVPGFYDTWYEGWGLIAAAMVTASALGGLASLVLHSRPIGPGAAASIGMAVAVASLFSFGAVFVAGRAVGVALGWHPDDGPDNDYLATTLIFGVFGLVMTWWYMLPVGALGGWLAWRAAARRNPSTGRAAAAPLASRAS